MRTIADVPSSEPLETRISQRARNELVHGNCYDKSAVTIRLLPFGGASNTLRHDSSASSGKRGDCLGSSIKELLHAKGWSQERLAERADLDRSYVAGIEVGKRNRSLKTLDQLSSALAVSMVDLFDQRDR